MKRILILPLLLLTTFLFAQSSTGLVRGLVIDEKGQPLPGAAILLTQPDTTTLVKGEVTDDAGLFTISDLAAGNYLLSIQYVGFDRFVSEPITLSGGGAVDLGRLQLGSGVQNLDAVEVKARVPLIERKLDRVIINVENSILSTGGTALEVLARSPGVVVDQDGNISLKGRAGVIVMIDGKPAQLSAADLSNLLTSTPAASVSKVEIMTNPSARFDAAGNAGIINIRMKKDQRLGANGGLNLSYGQGRYPKFNGGANFNYRNKWINLFGNYNVAFREAFANLELDRSIREEGQVVRSYDQNNFVVFPFKNHLPRLGADFFLSDRTTVGVLVSGIANKFEPRGRNSALILDPQKNLTGSFATESRSDDFWYNYAGNVNLRHTLDTLGRELAADLDYITYGNDGEQIFTTDFFNAENQLDRQTYQTNLSEGLLTIRSAKVDYTHPLRNGHVFETGAKSSWVESDSDLGFYNRIDGQDVLDPLQSNHFIYEEYINAGYLNYQMGGEKLSWQLGLRGEHTLAKGLQIVNDSSFRRDYFQLFPSFAVTYNASEKHSFNVTMSRRINRPGYGELNPFRRFIAPNTYNAGNPFLTPELAYSAEVSHTLNSSFTTTLSFGYTEDVLTSVLITDRDRNVVQTFRNIPESFYYGLGLSLSREITKWWSTNTNFQGFYNRYVGLVAGSQLDQGRPSFSISTNNSLSLGKGFTGEVNANYNYRQVYGVSIIEPLWDISLGVQKQILQGKGTVRLNFNDIFWTAWPRGYTGFGNLDEAFESQRDSRVVTLGFNYRFGKGTVAPARRRATGAEEEQQRVRVGG